MILILNGSACRTLKIIPNDIKIGTILWDLWVEKTFLNFCVGENVGRQLATNFLNESKRKCASFDTKMVTESDRGTMVSPEKPSKTYTLQGLKLRGLR